MAVLDACGQTRFEAAKDNTERNAEAYAEFLKDWNKARSVRQLERCFADLSVKVAVPDGLRATYEETLRVIEDAAASDEDGQAAADRLYGETSARTVTVPDPRA
ncbi:hypothetical protein ABT160_02080 [Streptomyces sp. NPDC001941]|uniref:hypothetical protein n=1 Tax=Streptomyces sp. NPDC001941 TaxID=3154659 RepID=UPI003320B1A9